MLTIWSVEPGQFMRKKNPLSLSSAPVAAPKSSPVSQLAAPKSTPHVVTIKCKLTAFSTRFSSQRFSPTSLRKREGQRNYRALPAGWGLPFRLIDGCLFCFTCQTATKLLPTAAGWFDVWFHHTQTKKQLPINKRKPGKLGTSAAAAAGEGKFFLCNDASKTKHFPNHRLHRYALVVVQAVHVEWVLQQSGWFLTTTMMMKKSHPIAIDGLPGLDAIFYLCH